MADTHPNVVVLLAGRWEVVDREYQGKYTNILSPTFAAYVKHQLELTSSLVTAAGSNMVFLTAPCTDEGEQPDGAPWPEDNPARLAVYNQLVREVAAEHPATDSVVDLHAAVCPGGKYSATKDGVQIRTPNDGVHFTIAAGKVLAPDLMPAIVAAGRAQMAAAGDHVKRLSRVDVGGRSAVGSGLMLTFVSATTHCALSEGSRWPSSTSAPSEMVVMSEFHEPSSELAWAANGRASRSSPWASRCSWAAAAAADVAGHDGGE